MSIVMLGFLANLAAGEVWFDEQLDLDPAKLIFIDESKAKTNMARIRGRARRGARCRAANPDGHWNTTTFTAGLRPDGIAAPMLLPGPTDGNDFRAYVEKVLFLELAPGDTAIMDIEGGQAIADGPAIVRQIPAHKVSGIR